MFKPLIQFLSIIKSTKIKFKHYYMLIGQVNDIKNAQVLQYKVLFSLCVRGRGGGCETP